MGLAPFAKSMAEPPAMASRSVNVAAALAFGFAIAQALVPTPAWARGPDSLADLAASVSDAVVNISAAEMVEDKSASAMPDLPHGTPFDELFNQFFRRRQELRGPGGKPVPLPREQRANSLGSGFVIDPSGIIVTNDHVIEGANAITVIFADGRKLKAKVVGKDSKVDVAVLSVKPGKPLKAVHFGDSSKARVGDWVMAVGNPFGLGGTVTAGIISARNRNIDNGPYDDYIQTDAAINKGNSGGPLFNMDGEVIGINTAILSPSGGSIGIGFATPANVAVPVIEQLRKYGETRRGWLGVRIQNVDQDIAESLNLGAAHGALVAGVDTHGPAKAAGIKTGDVIIRFDGRDIRNSRALPRIVAATPVGKEVSVAVLRNGKEKDLRVTIGRLKEGEKQASLEAAKNKPRARGNSSVDKALGMEFSRMTAAMRKEFAIDDRVKGVVVTTVAPGSAAAAEHVSPGDTIAEIDREPVSSPVDVTKKVQELKKTGRPSALFLLVNPQGQSRFVPLKLE